MSNITLLHYNNYFNRKVKVEEEYTDYTDTNKLVINGVNFVPGDGINTSHIFGTSTLAMDYDYLLVTHTDTTATPNVEVIDSRWFIMDENRTRDGQYEVGLRRDVIADHYEETLNATTYIEKGNVQVDNPLLFNKEGLLLNQIKTDEILLNDKSGCPWIVGYIAKDAYTSDTTINYNPANHDYIEVAAATINDWEYKTYDTNKFLGTIDSSSFTTRYQAGEWWIYN